MKPTRLTHSFALTSLCAVLLHGQSSAAKHPAEPTRPTSTNPVAPPNDGEPIARIVPYGEKDVVKLKAKLRYTTLIVLPKNEKILDFTCGDKEFWIVQRSENMAYVKPAKAGARTNMNLITASGNIYSFILTEVSEMSEGTPSSAPDLKVFIEPKDESMVSAASGTPRFVSAQALDDYRQQADLAKEETRQVKQAA